jgi:hypothetical protein
MLFRFGRGMRGTRDAAPARAYPGATTTAAAVIGSASALNDTTPTFTRATSAWDPRTNTIVGANVRRRDFVSIGGRSYQSDLIEGPRTNLLAAGTSDYFATGWALDSLDFTYTHGVSGPSADMPASLAVETLTTSGRVIVGQSITKAASAIQYTASLYIKNYSGTRTLVFDMSDNAGSGSIFSIIIATGVVTQSAQGYGASAFTAATGRVENAGNGWFRVSITATSNTNTTLRLSPQTRETFAGPFSYTGDGTSGCYVTAVCVEQAAFPSTHVSNRNLLTYSEVIDDASWSKTRSSVSANSVANPIDGATTADTIIDTIDANTQHYFSKAVSKAASSLTYTFSAYGRRKERDFVLRVTDTGFTNGCRAFFNLTTGALLSSDAFGAGFAIVGTPSATSVIASDGSQWYRCQITVTTDTSAFVRAAIELIEAGIADDTYTGDGTSGVYVYGLQLEYGSVATTYWSVLGTVGLRAADSLTSSATGFSDSRTNILRYSEQMDHAAWAKTDVTITANDAASPLGDTTADLCTEGAAGTANTAQPGAAGQPADSIYTISVYIKRGNCDWVRLNASSTGGTVRVWFNVALGTQGATPLITGTDTLVSSGIVSAGGGWYRLYIVAQTSGGATQNSISFFSALADANVARAAAGATYHAWGGQMVLGSTLTNYLPVAGTAVSAAQTGLSTTNGSLYIVAKPMSVDQDGATTYRILNGGGLNVGRSTASAIQGNFTDSAAAQTVSANHGFAVNTRQGFAFTYDATAVRSYVAGVAGTPDTVLVLPFALGTSVTVGSNAGTSQHFFGYVLSLYWHNRVITAQEALGLWVGTSR